LISTSRCRVLLQWVLLMQIVLNVGTTDTIDTWFSFASESFLLQANFTKLSRCSSLPGIIRMVSIRLREIFPLIKCESIFDLTVASRIAPVPSPAISGEGTSPMGATSIGICLRGTLVCENRFLSPHNLFSCCRVACSSSSNTSTKLAAPKCTFPSLGFLQHRSSECPSPVQKEHLIPQFSVLCGILHLAHFGRASFSLGHVVAMWSPPLQSWHPPDIVEEDDAIKFSTLLLKKFTSVLFKVVTCFSIIVSSTPSSCSSFKGSKGVSPNSPSTLSSSVAAATSSSTSANVLTTHNFRISGLNLAKNLLLCSASGIFPFWNNLSRRSKYFWTLFLGFYLMASSFTHVIRIHTPVLLYDQCL